MRSDIIAMGAIPTAFLLLTITMMQMMIGLVSFSDDKEFCVDYKCNLIGGDITKGTTVQHPHSLASC